MKLVNSKSISLRIAQVALSGFLTLTTTSRVVQAGIQTFDLILQPTEEFVHYNDGFIRSPGSIDLSGLTFEAISESFVGSPNDDATPADGASGNDNGGNVRDLDGGEEADGTAVDIAIFPLPSKCANSKTGCDWVSLGIGKRSADDSTLRWCCSDQAVDLGLCRADDKKVYGRLLLNETIFTGSHRFVTVPATGPMSKKIRYGKIDLAESATYVVLYANCNERGREVKVTGQSIWKSKHGYLPGELFGFMYFYTFITVVYFLLFFWFGTLMHINEDHRIEIEKWILFAITLGLLEMIFRTGDYFVWNADGVRSSFIIWIGILAGVLKQGISRCLLVMVSLGWGVVRDTLGSTMRVIVILGVLYVGTSAAIDLMMVFAVEAVNSVSYSEEKSIMSVLEIITFVKAAIDAIFIMWVLDALGNTMLYLENMSQNRKLERFLKLRCIFLFSVLFAVAWAVFSMVDKYNDEGIIAEEHAWAVDAATELNYLAVLIGVAYLWRPNESAREYAYVMELPANGGDDDNCTELEMTGTIPSAMDDDDDEPGSTNGFHDDNERTKEINRFEIG